MSASTTRFIVELRAKPMPGQGANPIVSLMPVDALSLQAVERQAEATVLAGVADQVFIYAPVKQVVRNTTAAVTDIRPPGLLTLTQEHVARDTDEPA